VDADAARVAVETNAVAFDTEQAGTRAAGSVAFADDEVSPGYDDLVADLAGVLERGYDTVDITDGAVIARETAFDPELAAKRGVPEGPAFGRLASGGVGRSRRRNDRAGGRVARADKPIPDRLPTLTPPPSPYRTLW